MSSYLDEASMQDDPDARRWLAEEAAAPKAPPEEIAIDTEIDAAKAKVDEAEAARQAIDEPDNQSMAMEANLRAAEAANEVAILEQRRPFVGKTDDQLALELEELQIQAEPAPDDADRGPGHRARAERIAAEARDKIPFLQLEQRRRAEAANTAAAMERFADRAARTARHAHLTEIDKQIAAEQGRHNEAARNGRAYDFSKMRRLTDMRARTAQAALTDAPPSEEELAAVRENWKSLGLSQGRGSSVTTYG